MAGLVLGLVRVRETRREERKVKAGRIAGGLLCRRAAAEEGEMGRYAEWTAGPTRQ
jgi:hypothetical protein